LNDKDLLLSMREVPRQTFGAAASHRRFPRNALRINAREGMVKRRATLPLARRGIFRFSTVKDHSHRLLPGLMPQNTAASTSRRFARAR